MKLVTWTPLWLFRLWNHWKQSFGCTWCGLQTNYFFQLISLKLLPSHPNPQSSNINFRVVGAVDTFISSSHCTEGLPKTYLFLHTTGKYSTWFTLSLIAYLPDIMLLRQGFFATGMDCWIYCQPTGIPSHQVMPGRCASGYCRVSHMLY